MQGFLTQDLNITKYSSWVWWHTHLIPALQRQKQAVWGQPGPGLQSEFQGHTEKPCPWKTKKQNKMNQKKKKIIPRTDTELHILYCKAHQSEEGLGLFVCFAFVCFFSFPFVVLEMKPRALYTGHALSYSPEKQPTGWEKPFLPSYASDRQLISKTYTELQIVQAGEMTS